MLRLIVTLLLGVFAHLTLADEPEAIVGGQLAKPGEFPYQCSLNVYGEHICGCSILTSTKILTAAHCVEDLKRPYYKVVVRTGSIDHRKGKDHTVKSIKSHPEYRAENEKDGWPYDVAVITLKTPIIFIDGNVERIELADSKPIAGTSCVLSGWGDTKAGGGDTPQYLYKMNTALLPERSCEQRLNMRLSSSHLCAFTKRGIGACQGDSGGPLVCNGKQYGITSFVVPCAKGKPDVYTNVYDQLDFIKQAMAN